MWKYISDHWQGKQSLAWSVFINGVLVYLFLVSILVAAAEFVNLPVFLGITVFAAIMLWSLIGIARAALKVVVDPNGTVIRRALGGLVLIGEVVVLYLTVVDLERFGLL